MKRAVRHIDRAIKSIYGLDPTVSAEKFLVGSSAPVIEIASASRQGALLIQPDSHSPEDVSVGIYLSPNVSESLGALDFERPHLWSHAETSAFAVATEEISHFHYFVFHAAADRAVTQLELEIQAEVDKFLLLYFARRRGGRSAARVFSDTLSQLFDRFHLAEELTDIERARYAEASRLALRLILKIKPLCVARGFERGLKWLRRYYRLDRAEKLSRIDSRVL